MATFTRVKRIGSLKPLNKINMFYLKETFKSLQCGLLQSFYCAFRNMLSFTPPRAFDPVTVTNSPDKEIKHSLVWIKL